MGRPRVRKDEVATTRRLLEAAERAFGAVGYAEAKLADIAAEAGISRPSLLYHYKSKYELYVAVVQTVFEDLGRALTEAMTSEDVFEARLDRIVDRFRAFLEERPSVARLILREVMHEQGPGHSIILKAAVPVLEMIERFIVLHGEDRIRAEVPIRAALLHLVSGAFVRAASGSLEAPLWGSENHLRTLARTLLLKSASPPSASNA